MEKIIAITKDYLYIPIQTGAEASYLSLFEEESGEKILEFKIPAGKAENGIYPCVFFARVPVEEWKNKKLVLKGEFPQEFFNSVKVDDYIETARENRPEIHFTADTGWINDPNGLVFDGVNYHLYFQYNPFDVAWENMSWGHAISKDLLHWQQLDTVLFPDEKGTMFSGCGLKNDRKMLGLPENALLFFYTSAGDTSQWSKGMPFTQRIAYSVDGGKHLQKLEVPYVDKIGKDSRDPKIFWHEETQAYIMVLYIEDDVFAILRSTNLKTWEETHRFSLEKAWECPDLLKVPKEEGGSQWMFWCADGYYYWGDFDGYEFHTDGVRHKAYLSKIPYAAQTYSGVENRIISVSWLRFPNDGTLYTGAMGIPREFTCRSTGHGYTLVQKEVEELQKLWKPVTAISQDAVYKAVLTMKKDEPSISRLKINGSVVEYDPHTGILKMEDEQLQIGSCVEEISLIVDKNILEVGLSGDIMIGIYKLNESDSQFAYEIPESAQIQLFEMEK